MRIGSRYETMKFAARQESEFERRCLFPGCPNIEVPYLARAAQLEPKYIWPSPPNTRDQIIMSTIIYQSGQPSDV